MICEAEPASAPEGSFTLRLRAYCCDIPALCATAWSVSAVPERSSATQARFRREQITFVGKSTEWTWTAESGNVMTHHFCPTCGSTVFWENDGFPGQVTVAIGNFADPKFPAPTIAVWEESRPPGFPYRPDTPPKRAAKQG